MSDDIRIKIGLSNAQGNHEFVYTPPQLNDLIRTLIEYALQPQIATALQGESPLVDNPIHADRLTFEPAPDSNTDMILLIGAQAFELQFRVPVADVVAMLRRLEDETEEGPSTPHHH
jgi:hypothetical protein